MAALLPPSSRMARAKRAASAGADGAAHRGGAGGGDERDEWAVDELLADGGVADEERGEAVGDACRIFAAARSKMAWVARAVRGVFSDGFQTTALPQTRASAAFQLQTATGKLKAEMMPTTPSGMPGLHHAVLAALGGER